MIKLKERELEILKIINESQAPIGSGQICSQLVDLGEEISEATVGRLLRKLDKEGLTLRDGFKGRILTQKGGQILSEHQEKEEHSTISEKLAQFAKVEAKEELLNILIARRAIERELARLAAEKATKEDILELDGIIRRNELNVKEGLSGAQEDILFHKTIARIANNNLLATALELIRKNIQLVPVLEYIRNLVGSTVIADHKKILNYIKKGQAEEAEEAMLEHLANIIADVERYWEKVHQE